MRRTPDKIIPIISFDTSENAIHKIKGVLTNMKINNATKMEGITVKDLEKADFTTSVNEIFFFL